MSDPLNNVGAITLFVEDLPADPAGHIWELAQDLDVPEGS
jgi:hypothetical protein